MRKLLLIFACVSCFAGTANAQTVYNAGDLGTAPHPLADAAKSAFLADAATVGALQGPIDFESLALGYASPINIAPGVSVTFAGADPVLSGITTNAALDIGFNTTPAGSQFLRFIPNFNEPGSITFSFANPVSAFGGYLTSVESSFGTTTVTFFDGSNQLFPITGPTGANTQFWGVTDAGRSFSSITFNEIPAASGRDGLGFDDLYFAIAPSTGAVPEPSTWAMMLLGFGFIGGAMRGAKRRQKVTARYA